MAKYLVAIYYTASREYEVEAKDEEQAVERATAIQEDSDTWSPAILASLEHSDAMVVEGPK